MYKHTGTPNQENEMEYSKRIEKRFERMDGRSRYLRNCLKDLDFGNSLVRLVMEKEIKHLEKVKEAIEKNPLWYD